MPINFKKYQEGKLSINTVSALLKKGLKQADYFQINKEDLTYKCLKLFDFEGLEQTPDSIVAFAEKVISCEKLLLSKVGNPVNVFLLIYLDIKNLPIQAKIELEATAKEHLNTLDELLKFHRDNGFIKEYEQTPLKPRNQQEKTQLEFYQRTLRKREQVIGYLTKGGLEERAIAKANPIKLPGSENFEQVKNMFDLHMDFPYLDLIYKPKEVTYGIDIDRLDYRRINSFYHKIHMMAGVDLADGYLMDMAKPIEIKLPVESLIDDMLKNIDYIPLVNKRKVIFQELKALYHSKSWYGFYALALPQIEGIFSEIVHILKAKQPKGSLPEKVNLVRNYHSASKYTFDYFEFFLPEWRNQFAHTGLVDQVENRCKYLVMDLKYLLDTCINLDSPISRISKTLKDGPDSIDGIDDLAEFLMSLMAERKNPNLQHIQDKIDDYIYNGVLAKLDIENTWDNVEVKFKAAKIEAQEQFLISLAVAEESPFKLFELPPAEIDRKIASISTAFHAFDIMLCEPLRLIFDAFHITKYLPHCFPDIEKPLTDRIERFSTAFKNELTIISILDNKAKIYPSTSYLLTTPPPLIRKK